jgi:hypothetical protein
LCPAPLALAIALSINVAHAATIVVDSAGTDSESGKCTIVDAVQALNTAAAVNNCIAGDGNSDIIDLNSFTSPTTITFTSAQSQSHALVINNQATISAPVDATGNPLVTLTRSSSDGTPVFGIIQSNAALDVEGLQITNGDSGNFLGGGILAGNSLIVGASVISGNHSNSAGGGIAATGKLTIQNSIVTGNKAGNVGGGVYGSTGVEIDYSTIKSNSTSSATGPVNGGGGIFSSGALRLMRADILDNTSASAGGGVYAAQGMNVTSSTISGNLASNGSGGGLYANPSTVGANVIVSYSTIDTNTAQGNGGGILGGTTNIANSTIVGNMASGTGGGVQTGTLMMNYTTVTQNQSAGDGGGVNFGSSAEVDATILVNNTIAGTTPDDIEGGAAITGQYDIIVASNAGVPDQTLSCDPQLSPLADNGGPTQTMALTAGSCAIDKAGTVLTVDSDQRGFARAVGGGDPPVADIGAYEFGSMDPDKIFSNGFEGT